MLIPARLLTETITVEPYLGVTAGTATFGAPSVVRAQVQAQREHPARKTPSSNSANLAVPPPMRTWVFDVWTRPGPVWPVGSRVTVRGTAATVTRVDDNTAPDLPGPAHLQLRVERAEFLPTASVTVQRGTPTADGFGDLVDTPTVVAAGLEAAVVQTGQTSNQPADERLGVVDTYTIRLRAGCDVREGDRIVDDTAAAVYRVLQVQYPPPVLGPQLGTDDVHAVCRRVAATSHP